MILYHGTNVEFKNIDLSKSLPYKDFGVGFYLTSLLAQAERMASRKSHRYGTAVVQAYEIDDAVLAGQGDCKVKVFEEANEEWALFILANRKHTKPPYQHDYDIVAGSVADDGIAYILSRYEEGTMSLKEALKELKFAHLSIQYCFCTQKAINHLKRIAL